MVREYGKVILQKCETLKANKQMLKFISTKRTTVNTLKMRYSLILNHLSKWKSG